jgi:adenosine deaminase
MDFQGLPKVELHLHLDCCLSFDVAAQLTPGLARAEFEQNFVAPPKCRDLADYLTRPPHHVALMQTEAALRLVVADLFAQLQRDRVLYAELRFAPLLHTQRGLTPEQVVAAVEAAVEAQARATGIEARLILCTLRHFSPEQSLTTVKLVEAFRGSRVAALDIAGDEAGYPVAAHVPAFEYAGARGLARTAHAGEARGAESVWETLRAFQPTRLGHGVRSIEDERLLGHLVAQGIHLEICPSCNVQIDVVPTYAEHPIDRLFRRGLSLSVNTDTRTITAVTLAQEYQRLHQYFGWDTAHFLACNLNALQAAFIPAALKRDLSERLRAAYAEFD